MIAILAATLAVGLAHPHDGGPMGHGPHHQSPHKAPYVQKLLEGLPPKPVAGAETPTQRFPGEFSSLVLVGIEDKMEGVETLFQGRVFVSARIGALRVDLSNTDEAAPFSLTMISAFDSDERVQVVQLPGDDLPGVVCQIVPDGEDNSKPDPIADGYFIGNQFAGPRLAELFFATDDRNQTGVYFQDAFDGLPVLQLEDNPVETSTTVYFRDSIDLFGDRDVSELFEVPEYLECSTMMASRRAAPEHPAVRAAGRVASQLKLKVE